MKVIVIGAGEVGYNISDILSKEKHDVTLIDHNEERIKDVAENLNVETLHGSGSSPEILKKAGSTRPTWSSPSRTATKPTSWPASSPHAVAAFLQDRPHPQSRARRVAEIFDKDHLNINLCINPEREAVKIALDLMEFPGATEVMDFHDGRIKLVGFPVQSSSVTGKTLQQLREINPDARCS